MTSALVQPREQALAKAEERLNHYTEQAYSEATRRAYTADWTRYADWCRGSGFDPLGSPVTVAHYLSALADQGAKVATIERKLSAICAAWTAADLDSPRTHKAVQYARRGIRRALRAAQDQVEALTPAHLRQIVESMPQGERHFLRTIRNRALLVVGFAGAFRRSELVGLDVADVANVEEGLKITLRRSKTDQEGKGRLVGLPYGSVSYVCPVRSLAAWLQASGIEEGPLFRAVSQDGKTVSQARLCDRQVANVIKTCCERAGISGRYAGHSLRSGLVTAAVRGGKPIDAIQRQTGHSSVEMLMRYVREQGIFDNNAAAGLL